MFLQIIQILLLLYIALYDIRNHLVSFLALVGIAISIVVQVILGLNNSSFNDMLIGSGIGFIAFGGIYIGGLIYKKFRTGVQGSAFGFGDVWLAAVCGMLVGAQYAILLPLVTILLAGLIVTLRWFIRKDIQRYDIVAFAPFMVIPTIVFMLIQ